MSNVGRPRKYTPEEFATGFEEYRRYTKATPKQVAVISRGEAVTIHKERPLTIVGFCESMGIAKSTFYDYAKRDGEEFSDIYARIRMVIEADQTEGAMLEIYNPSVTTRMLGLVNKQDITTDSTSLSPSPLIAIYNGERIDPNSEGIDGRE